MSMTSPTSTAERLDRLPFQGPVVRIVLLIALGFGLEIYDLFLTAYIAPRLVQLGFFTPDSLGPLAALRAIGIHGAGSFVFSLFSGLLVGSMMFSRIADRFGRRTVFALSMVGYSACTGIMAFQTTGYGIDVWRFLAGVGLGVELVTIDAYLAEWVAPAYRGRAFALCQLVGFSFVPLVAFCAWWLVPQTPLGIEGWRYVVLIGSIGAIAAWILRIRLRESPRWLEAQGRAVEAALILDEVEQDYPKGALEIAKPAIFPTAQTGLSPTALRRRIAVLSVFNFFQTFGYYGFSAWVPTLLMARGIEVTKSLEYAFIIALANPIAPMIGLWLGDRIERKWQIVIGALVVGLSGIAFSAATTTELIVICGVFVTLGNNLLSYAFHGYQSELFPTSVRSRNIGFVYGWSRVSAALSGPIFAALLGVGGTDLVFAFIALSMLIVVISIGVYGPHTSGKSLETITS